MLNNSRRVLKNVWILLTGFPKHNIGTGKMLHLNASNLSLHTPVLCDEVIQYMSPLNKSVVIDMTFGAGGHTKALLNSEPTLKIICLDRDPIAFKLAKNLAAEYPNQIFPFLGKFSELPRIMLEAGFKTNSVEAILFDFGCSSMQFDFPDRGFSLSKPGPLDMRMDGDRFPHSPTAADVIAHATEEDLAKIFKVYGQEKKAKKIARAIVEARYTTKKINTTTELANFISAVCSNEYRSDKLQRHSHVGTKVFQALRIFVNNELNEINYGIKLAHRFLKLGGRVVAISFHSLEDTIVKRHFSGNLIEGAANPLPLKYSAYNFYHKNEILDKFKSINWLPTNKHVVTPTSEEIQENPRSRSAKLRAATKIG